MTEGHSIFRKWMTAMGYHGKQVSAAAQAIGIRNPTTASQTYKGDREPTVTELLAMSALRAGLDPWSEESDHLCRIAGEVTAVVRDRIGTEPRSDDKAAQATTP